MSKNNDENKNCRRRRFRRGNFSDIRKRRKIETDDERIRPKLSEVNRLFGDNKLLKELTDWEQQYGGFDGFKKGLKKTIEWFSRDENIKHYKTGIYSV